MFRPTPDAEGTLTQVVDKLLYDCAGMTKRAVDEYRYHYLIAV
jgi:hypothetical protein